MAEYGVPLVLAAGGLTFANEWLQTDQLNFRVPVATLLGAGAIGIISQISPGAANSLGILVLLAAASTRLNGKSPLDELSAALPKQKG